MAGSNSGCTEMLDCASFDKVSGLRKKLSFPEEYVDIATVIYLDSVNSNIASTSAFFQSSKG